jgi:hypothetical protein
LRVPSGSYFYIISFSLVAAMVWALEKNKESDIRTKIILTSGSFMDLDKAHKVWFYYDQGGKYTQKLKITHVPAIVKQDGIQLKITEISNNEI